MGRDAGRAFTYLTPAVRDYQYFYLGVADTLIHVTFHVRACHDALILLKSEVRRAFFIVTRCSARYQTDSYKILQTML